MESLAEQAARARQAEEAADATGEDNGSQTARQSEAVNKLGAGRELSDQEASEALAWFLSEEHEERAWKEVELNVSGNPESEHWIRFKVVAIARERIQSIRKSSVTAKGRSQGTGETDDMQANLRIATEGIVEPDLKEVAQQKGLQDPTIILKARLEHKPGLIDQLANNVVNVSGWDEKDVRDVSTLGN